jgi:hypothetical protein
MKRALSVFLSLLLLSSAANAEHYLWTLSASTTDPYDNTAAPTAGLSEVQLWLACSTEGMSSAQFDVEVTSGHIVILAWTPCCGFLLNGPSLCPFLAVGGCPSGPIRAGWFLVFDPAGWGGSLCIVECETSGLNHTVDCGVTPQLWPNAWIGFSSDETPPCSSGDCGPVSVEAESWGRIKSVYR